MAFNLNGNNSRNSNGNDDWKAQAFLNLWVPKPDGSRLKIGAIPLKESRKNDAALIKRLSEEDGLASLMDKLEIDFQIVDESKSVELGF